MQRFATENPKLEQMSFSLVLERKIPIPFQALTESDTHLKSIGRNTIVGHLTLPNLAYANSPYE